MEHILLDVRPDLVGDLSDDLFEFADHVFIRASDDGVESDFRLLGSPFALSSLYGLNDVWESQRLRQRLQSSPNLLNVVDGDAELK